MSIQYEDQHQPLAETRNRLVFGSSAAELFPVQVTHVYALTVPQPPLVDQQQYDVTLTEEEKEDGENTVMVSHDTEYPHLAAIVNDFHPRVPPRSPLAESFAIDLDRRVTKKLFRDIKTARAWAIKHKEYTFIEAFLMHYQKRAGIRHMPGRMVPRRKPGVPAKKIPIIPAPMPTMNQSASYASSSVGFESQSYESADGRMKIDSAAIARNDGGDQVQTSGADIVQANGFSRRGAVPPPTVLATGDTLRCALSYDDIASMNGWSEGCEAERENARARDAFREHWLRTGSVLPVDPILPNGPPIGTAEMDMEAEVITSDHPHSYSSIETSTAGVFNEHDLAVTMEMDYICNLNRTMTNLRNVVPFAHRSMGCCCRTDDKLFCIFCD